MCCESLSLDPGAALTNLQVVTPTSDGISVDVQYERSDAQLDKWGERHGVPDVIVATGFIAKNPQGQVWHIDCKVTGTKLLQPGACCCQPGFLEAQWLCHEQHWAEQLGEAEEARRPWGVFLMMTSCFP